MVFVLCHTCTCAHVYQDSTTKVADEERLSCGTLSSDMATKDKQHVVKYNMSGTSGSILLQAHTGHVNSFTSCMWSDLKQRFAAGPESIYDKLFTLVSEDMKPRSIERKVEPTQVEVCHERHQSSTPLRAV